MSEELDVWSALEGPWLGINDPWELEACSVLLSPSRRDYAQAYDASARASPLVAEDTADLVIAVDHLSRLPELAPWLCEPACPNFT